MYIFFMSTCTNVPGTKQNRARQVWFSTKRWCSYQLWVMSCSLLIQSLSSPTTIEFHVLLWLFTTLFMLTFASFHVCLRCNSHPAFLRTARNLRCVRPAAEPNSSHIAKPSTAFHSLWHNGLLWLPHDGSCRNKRLTPIGAITENKRCVGDAWTWLLPSAPKRPGNFTQKESRNLTKWVTQSKKWSWGNLQTYEASNRKKCQLLTRTPRNRDTWSKESWGLSQ